MALSEIQQQILFEAQLNARLPASRIAKRAGVTPHVVQYHLKKLLKNRCIRPVPFLNAYALALEKYQILFSLATTSDKQVEVLMEDLRTSWRTPWVAELGAEYQYGITVCATGLTDLSNFLDGLAERHGQIFLKKTVVPIVSFTYFRKRYLARNPEEVEPKFLSLYRPEQIYRADEIDYKLLAFLFNNGALSNREIARETGIPRATVDSRILKMEEAQVIKSHIYAVCNTKLGVLTYLLLVHVAGLKRGFKEQLFAACASHPRVVNFTHGLGSWDFQIGLEVKEASDATIFSRALQNQFAHYIREIKVVPVFREEVSKKFMWIPTDRLIAA